MPKATDPNSLEWYVYQFEVRGIPFYVGIGRSKRASNRTRWVCAQIKRELAGKLPLKEPVLSNRVIRALILTPETIKTRKIREHLCREEALDLEEKRIAELVAKGHVLANLQHNPNPAESEKEIIAHIRKMWRARVK
jgi:hypothetical protein